MCFTSTSVHATPLSSVLVANMMPLCGHRWLIPLAMDGCLGQYAVFCQSVPVANTVATPARLNVANPCGRYDASLWTALPVLVADTISRQAYGQHCQSLWPMRHMLKPVLNWANVCSPEHTSDTSTNYDSFLN